MSAAILPLSAQLETDWQDFTPGHARAFAQALAVLRGDQGQRAAAIVGVYGSGKSTLMFNLLRRAPDFGVAGIWDEAGAFLARLIGEHERVLPQQFVTRAKEWTASLRRGDGALDAYCAELDARGHGAVSSLVRSTVGSPAGTTALFLDEVEQAHHLFARRIDTADGQPLRALIDACDPAFRLFLAYAPESFHSIGDADRGRLVHLAVPALDASAIQSTFSVSRGAANFVWWASRGRARGVLKALREVLLPAQSGGLLEKVGSLEAAVDALPGVFGVPAILRERLSRTELRQLLDLVPRAQEASTLPRRIDLRDKHRLAERLEEKLSPLFRDGRGSLEPIVDELLVVLDAICDEELRCYLTFDDIRAALKLAEGRAIESGRLQKTVEGMAQEAAVRILEMGEHDPVGKRLPFELNRMAEEIFPSPFTDPKLPLRDGDLPSADQIERYYLDVRADRPVILRSERRKFSVFHDMASLDAWFRGELSGGRDESPVCVFLIEGGAAPTPLIELGTRAGRLSCRDLNGFHALFLKCLAIKAREKGCAGNLDEIEADLRKNSQLARKVEWHLRRIEGELLDLQPAVHPNWALAVQAIKGDLFRSDRARMAADSPGLLALLYPFKVKSASTTRVLSELGELLSSKSSLRKLAHEAGSGSQTRYEGAAVVVDELLPAKGKKQRWIDTDFPGRAEVQRLLERSATVDDADVLASLVHPDERARIACWIRFFKDDLPEIGAERQQLSALRGLRERLKRVRLVRDRLAALIGANPSQMNHLAIGELTHQAVGAERDMEGLEKLSEDANALQDAWAKTLGLWITGVFAERIRSGVEREEATLKAWEDVAEKSVDLAKRATKVERDLTKQKLDACARTLGQMRDRLRSSLTAIERLREDVSSLSTAVDQYEALAKDVGQLRTALKKHSVSIDSLLAQHDVYSDRIAEETERAAQLTRAIVEMGEVPRPRGDQSLTDYGEALLRHAAASKESRLRMRLTELFEHPFDEAFRVAPTDVAAIEQEWGILSESARERYRPEIVANGRGGSDELCRWLREAAAKEELLEGWGSESDPLPGFDDQVIAWARRVAVRPDQLNQVKEQRAAAIQDVENLQRSRLTPEVVAQFLRMDPHESGERLYPGLAKRLRAFQESLDDLEPRLGRALGEAPGGKLPGASPEEVVSLLRERLDAATSDQKRAYEKLVTLQHALQRLEEIPSQIRPDLSLRELATLAGAEERRVVKALDARQARCEELVTNLGLPKQLGTVSRDPDPARVLDACDDVDLRMNEAKPLVEELHQHGEPVGPFNVADWADVLSKLQDGVDRARDTIKALQAKHGALRARLARLGGTSEAPAAGVTISEWRAHVKSLEDEVERQRKKRLEAASPEARAIYKALVGGSRRRSELPDVLRELVNLGLVRAVEES